MRVSKILPVIKEHTSQLTLKFTEQERKLTLSEVIRYLQTADAEKAIEKSRYETGYYRVYYRWANRYSFLESIIQRTFEDIAFECDGDVMVLPLQYIEREPGSFIEMVQTCAYKAIIDYSIMVLCIHTDAEAANDHRAFEFKITPAFESVQQSEEDVCKNLVAVVPVRMTERGCLPIKTC